MQVSAHSTFLNKRDTLEQYASLKISATDAMSMLNMQCLEDLFVLTSTKGFPLPHLDRQSAKSVANKFLKSVEVKNKPLHA